MPLTFAPMQPVPSRAESVFVSASIPDPARWDGEFDALEITDAVVALARTFLTAGFRLVTAAHPTIAPLLLYVAAEFPSEAAERVAVYQSLLFADVLPAATRRFEADGVGRLIWTAAAEGDRPELGFWDDSLAIMRRQMLNETEPIAACFVGGMEGIQTEYALYTDLFPERPTYPVGRPGGEARALLGRRDTALTGRLATDDTYPALWRAVVLDLQANL
jgi:SLOG cluster3 family